MNNEQIARKQTGWLMNPMEFKYGESPTPEADAYFARADAMRAIVLKLLDDKDLLLKQQEGEIAELRKHPLICVRCAELEGALKLAGEALESAEWYDWTSSSGTHYRLCAFCGGSQPDHMDGCKKELAIIAIWKAGIA